MARKGDILTDFVTANWYNDVTRSLGKKGGIGAATIGYQNQYCIVSNHTPTPQKVWTAVSRGETKPNYTKKLRSGTHQRLMYETKNYDGDDPDNLVILQKPLAGRVGSTAPALVLGSSWVRVPDDSQPYNYLGIDSSDELNYRPSGRMEVLDVVETTDMDPIFLAFVLIGPLAGQNAILIKTPSGGIDAATGSGPYTFGSATCDLVTEQGVVTSETETIYNIVNDSIAGSVIGKAERVGSIYIIDVASCS